MAYVRMYSPPARTVKRPNARWDRQRPSTRGAGVTDDHGGTDIMLPPDITAVTPMAVALGAGNTTFTITGVNFYNGATVSYAAAGGPETQASETRVSETSMTAVVVAADLDTAGTITFFVTNTDGQAVGAPSGARPTIA